MAAEHWISFRVDSSKLARLNELGDRFGGRSRFVLLAITLAESVTTLADLVGTATVTSQAVTAEQALAAVRSQMLALCAAPNEHDPAYGPGHAETPRLGRAFKEVAEA